MQQLVNVIANARTVRSTLRLHPFDTGTLEGRSKERYRRAALTTVTSMLARVVGIFTGLAWIRVSLPYLGKDRYGLWMAMGSLVSWMNLADLGLARGMQNHLSQANGEDDHELAARYVSTGLATLTAIALVIGAILAPFVFTMPWASLLNVREPALANETRAVVGAVLIVFLLEFPLSLVPTIYSAYQRGYVASLFTMVGSLASLIPLFVATKLELSLPWLILALGGTNIAMTLVNLGYCMREMPWLRPRLHMITKKALRALAGTSFALFVFQIGALLVNETQSVIIARRLGLAEVTDWSIFMRVYTLPAIFLQMIDAPLIPAYREASVRKEHDWLRTAFWRVTKFKMAVALVAAGLYVVWGNWAATLIAGQPIVFSTNVWIACGCLLVVAVWNGSFNDLMIGADRLRLLVATVLVNGLVTPALSYLLAPSLGLFGVVLATPVFSLVVSAWLLPYACRDLLRRAPAS
jgi:O-antigen/teichoic acid export membrane protein